MYSYIFLLAEPTIHGELKFSIIITIKNIEYKYSFTIYRLHPQYRVD